MGSLPINQAVMFWRELVPGNPERHGHAFMKRLFELKRRIAGAKAPRKFTKDWYAGRCAEPCDFTEQLVRLQEVLRSAGQTVLSTDCQLRGVEGGHPR